jgi:hypothetical protein
VRSSYHLNSCYMQSSSSIEMSTATLEKSEFRQSLIPQMFLLDFTSKRMQTRADGLSRSDSLIAEKTRSAKNHYRMQSRQRQFLETKDLFREVMAPGMRGSFTLCKRYWRSLINIFVTKACLSKITYWGSLSRTTGQNK